MPSDANDQARALARLIVGPRLPVPIGSQFSLDELRDVRWTSHATSQEKREALSLARAILAAGWRPPSSQTAGSEAVEATALTQIHRLEAEARWMGERSHMGSASLFRMSQRLFDIAAALSSTAPADVRRGGLQPDPAELDAIVQEGVERCSVAIRRLIDNPAQAKTEESSTKNREAVMTDDDEPKIGDYVLATKYDDGDPGDPWAVGYLIGKSPQGQYLVGANAEGSSFRPNGYVLAKKIRTDVGDWLLSISDDLERSPPVSVNLWKMLTSSAFETMTDDEIGTKTSHDVARVLLDGEIPLPGKAEARRMPESGKYILGDGASDLVCWTEKEALAFAAHLISARPKDDQAVRAESPLTLVCCSHCGGEGCLTHPKPFADDLFFEISEPCQTCGGAGTLVEPACPDTE